MKNVWHIFLVLIIFRTSATAQKISLAEVQKNLGQTVTVCGKIFGGSFITNAVNTPTLLYMGANSPNHSLTLVIFFENLKEFPAQPEIHYANQQVCVTGTIIDYKGQPEMILKSVNQIKPDIPNTTSANIFKDTVSRTVGITTNSGTPANPGVTFSTANKSNTTNTSNSPGATPNKTPNSFVTGGNRTVKTGAAPNKSATTSESDLLYDITLTQDVYMRSGPTFDHPLVTTVKAGTVVTVLSSSNGWSQVAIKDKDAPLAGYIKNSVLK
jgi:micrococcal nuclease